MIASKEIYATSRTWVSCTYLEVKLEIYPTCESSETERHGSSTVVLLSGYSCAEANNSE